MNYNPNNPQIWLDKSETGWYSLHHKQRRDKRIRPGSEQNKGDKNEGVLLFSKMPFFEPLNRAECAANNRLATAEEGGNYYEKEVGICFIVRCNGSITDGYDCSG